MVQSLHSVGFYRNSKGTKEQNTPGLVQSGRVGALDGLSVMGFRKMLMTTATCRAIGVFHGLLS